MGKIFASYFFIQKDENVPDRLQYTDEELVRINAKRLQDFKNNFATNKDIGFGDILKTGSTLLAKGAYELSYEIALKLIQEQLGEPIRLSYAEPKNSKVILITNAVNEAHEILSGWC